MLKLTEDGRLRMGQEGEEWREPLSLKFVLFSPFFCNVVWVVFFLYPFQH